MIQKILNNYSVILGSKSPRRQAFLKELNIPYEVRTSDAEEIYPHHLSAEGITEFLAQFKSNSIRLNHNELLITADTIVWQNDQAIGKPNSREEAVKILKELSNTSHEVISSICIATTEKTVVVSDKTTVHFDSLSKEEIDFYIDTYKPFDKAGSYGIQEWIGLIGVTKIEGTYSNVVGLPVHKLYKALKNF